MEVIYQGYLQLEVKKNLMKRWKLRWFVMEKFENENSKNNCFRLYYKDDKNVTTAKKYFIPIYSTRSVNFCDKNSCEYISLKFFNCEKYNKEECRITSSDRKELLKWYELLKEIITPSIDETQTTEQNNNFQYSHKTCESKTKSTHSLKEILRSLSKRSQLSINTSEIVKFDDILKNRPNEYIVILSSAPDSFKFNKNDQITLYTNEEFLCFKSTNTNNESTLNIEKLHLSSIKRFGHSCNEFCFEYIDSSEDFPKIMFFSFICRDPNFVTSSIRKYCKFLYMISMPYANSIEKEKVKRRLSFEHKSVTSMKDILNLQSENVHNSRKSFIEIHDDEDEKGSPEKTAQSNKSLRLSAFQHNSNSQKNIQLDTFHETSSSQNV